MLTVPDGVFPLILCLYYVCITLTFSISVFNCGLSIFNKRILLSLPNQPDKKTYADDVKKGLVKIANWFLDLAKNALTSLPGVFGEILSFILKKAAAVVLFFSEHLVIFLLALAVFIVEIIWKKRTETK